MKKSLVLLAGIGMAFIGLPAVTHAQAASGPFADVPTDHWAYQSVDTLQKAGIVIGYPDGTYGGRRPMTRYEFAVAIARLLAQMNKPAAPFDPSGLEAQIASNKAAIDALTALVNGFQPELTRLGVDVAANTARLDALEARLSRDEGILGAVKNEQDRLKITGEFNVIGEARCFPPPQCGGDLPAVSGPERRLPGCKRHSEPPAVVVRRLRRHPAAPARQAVRHGDGEC